MSDEDWRLLEAHFKERSIPMGTGIRMVLVEYLRKQGLLKSRQNQIEGIREPIGFSASLL